MNPARRVLTGIKKFIKPVAYSAEWLINPARARKRASYPSIINLPITDNCNSRCVMCSVWKTPSKDEITADTLRSLLSDELYHRVQHVGISGGEPSLRADLVDVVKAIVGTLPALRTLSITSHGFHTARWARLLPQIKEICNSNNVAFTFNLSFDGAGAVHDKIRGIPGAFDKIQKTIDLARQLGIAIELQSTILSRNVYHLGAMLRYANSIDADIVFRLATDITRLDNSDVIPEVALNDVEKSFFADFLTSAALHSKTSSPARRLFYHDLARRLISGAPRKAPCHFQREGLLISPHGELFHCSISPRSIGNAVVNSSKDLYFSNFSNHVREELLSKHCPSCFHDQSGAWPPLQLAREEVAANRYGKALAKAYNGALLLLRMPMLLFRARQNHRSAADHADDSLKRLRQNNTAVIIGAYGGEHVGDAAILGGVILRIIKTASLSKIYLVSFRPHRTERWVRSLELPVAVEVVPYDLVKLKKLLDNQQFTLVYGGGPIMDLPLLLSRHLDFANWAVSKGHPFVVEGVGLGPFKLQVSRQLAKSLLSLADHVTVRTTKIDKQLLRGIAVQTTVDPAFDYLKSRSTLNRISAREDSSLSELLQSADGRKLVGINLRPLWSKYAKGVSRSQLHEIQDRFLQELASSLVSLSSTNKITYIFFPMNADQFGFSDLEIAYKLRELLPANIDFRIWEFEPGVDAVLQLLRCLDAAVTMRFHATIFALSQEVPTVGIDYSVGAPGKVSALLEDLGMSENLSRVDTATSDWLNSHLLTHISPDSGDE